jgi:hypothetical protein
MVKNGWLEEHVFAVSLCFWVASVVAWLFTVGFNAVYWAVLPDAAFAHTQFWLFH